MLLNQLSERDLEDAPHSLLIYFSWNIHNFIDNIVIVKMLLRGQGTFKLFFLIAL